MFETQDFYLTAYLSAQGFPIAQWRREAGLTSFAFSETSELSELVGAYYGDRVTVSPIRYGNALKNLKYMIHSHSKHDNELISHKLGDARA